MRDTQSEEEYYLDFPLYTLVYEQSDWNENFGGYMKTVLRRCIPKEGVTLYEITATYAKHQPASTYYWLGTSERDVRGRFSNALTWLKILSVRPITSDEEAEEILTDPAKMPI